MDWPLKKNVPKSNANLPSFASSSAADGSSGTNTPTTPIRPVGRTAWIRLLMVRPGLLLAVVVVGLVADGLDALVRPFAPGGVQDLLHRVPGAVIDRGGVQSSRPA